MTCKHCCGADQLFDLKGAKKELKKYRKKGPGKTTKKLIELLFKGGVVDQSLIDIGGGIGAIQWAFIENGGKNTIGVDASSGYLSLARAIAEEKGCVEKVDLLQGDFVDLTENISESDFIALDKVICCYPDYKSLLAESLKKCKRSIGLTYPFGGIISKTITSLSGLYFYFKRNPFRTFVHDPREVQQFIIDHGFDITENTTSFPWHVQVYRRKH